MAGNLAELQDLVLRHCTQSTVTTAIPELTLYRAEAVSEPIPFVFEPRVYVIVQGRKQVMLRDRVFDYDDSHYLVTAVDLPVAGCITQASPERPYLALCLALDPVMIAELLLVVNDRQVDPNQACIMGMGLSPLNSGITEPLLRLMKLLDQPEDIPILKPLIVCELLYRLLQGDQPRRAAISPTLTGPSTGFPNIMRNRSILAVRPEWQVWGCPLSTGIFGQPPT